MGRQFPQIRPPNHRQGKFEIRSIDLLRTEGCMEQNRNHRCVRNQSVQMAPEKLSILCTTWEVKIKYLQNTFQCHKMGSNERMGQGKCKAFQSLNSRVLDYRDTWDQTKELQSRAKSRQSRHNHQVVGKCMTYGQLGRSSDGKRNDWVDASREEATWKTKSKRLGLCSQSSRWQS